MAIMWCAEAVCWHLCKVHQLVIVGVRLGSGAILIGCQGLNVIICACADNPQSLDVSSTPNRLVYAILPSQVDRVNEIWDAVCF